MTREVHYYARWKDTKTDGSWVASSVGAWNARHPACQVCTSTCQCTRNGSRTTYMPTSCFRRQTTITERDFPQAQRDQFSSLRRSNSYAPLSSNVHFKLQFSALLSAMVFVFGFPLLVNKISTKNSKV